MFGREVVGMDGRELWRFIGLVRKFEADAQVFRKDAEEADDEKKIARLEGKAVAFDMAAARVIRLLSQLNS